jgi:hypothetical protein
LPKSLLKLVCVIMAGKPRGGVRCMSRAEHCKNPWNGKCRNTDIEVFILYNGDRLPICRRCWSKIATSNIEWGEHLGSKED